MADKLVIYNPESNNASHVPSDTVKGNITIDGDIDVKTITPWYINFDGHYNLYYASNDGNIYLEPTDIISGNRQKYTFGSDYGIFIERNTPSSPNVIYCETKSTSPDTTSKMGIQGTGDVWGDRWKNNGRTGYQYMLSEYIDTLTTGNLTSGWTRLQNGLLLQWGTAISDKTGYASFTYPTAFTKVCKLFTILRAEWGTGDNIPVAFPDLGQETVSHNNLTVGGVICRQVNGSSGVTPINGGTCDWFAIGY